MDGSNLSISFPAHTGRFPFTKKFRKFRFGFKWSRGFRAFPVKFAFQLFKPVFDMGFRLSRLFFALNELIYANSNRSVYDLIGLYLPQLFIYFIYFQFVFYFSTTK